MGRIYTVNHLYKTIQGEGFYTGRVSVFCRFAGCNLWSGREKDRLKADCNFCDTEFRHGDKYSLDLLVERINSYGCDFVVFTGGEPGLQVDKPLLESLSCETAIETNGTVGLPNLIDWICVSPKTKNVVQKSGNELKLVYPQENISPEDVEDWDFDIFSLQPLDSPYQAYHIESAVEYCMENPKWRLSLQTHKFIGLP